MYDETTVIAIHARSLKPELFQLLEAVDSVATAVDPLPDSPKDDAVRAYALIFQPKSLSNRSEVERQELEANILSLQKTRKLSKCAVAVSRSDEARDARRFGFAADEDVVITISKGSVVQRSYRLDWKGLTEPEIAKTVKQIRIDLESIDRR